MKKRKQFKEYKAKSSKSVKKKLSNNVPENGNIPEEFIKVYNELQVSQIELEQQNIELFSTRQKLEEVAQKYANLYNNAPIGYIIVNEKGVITEANSTIAELLGVDKNILINKLFQRYIYKHDKKIYKESYAKLLESNVKQKIDLRMLANKGELFWTELTSVVIEGGGSDLSVSIIITDISERKKMEEMHLFLSTYNSTDKNENFFKSLARYLASTLEMDYISIDKLHADLFAANTLAIYYDGKFEDNVEYNLKETPCGDVVSKTICCYTEGARHLFQKDNILQKMSAESYIRATLFSNISLPIGLISCIGRKTLKNQNLTESILKLAAIRTSAELERKEAEDSIHKSEERFRNMFERSKAVMLLIEPISGDIVDANVAAAEYYGWSRQQLCSMKIQEINYLSEKEVAAERMKALEEKNNYFNFRHRLANEEIRWVEVYSSPIEILGKQMLYSIIHDITERKYYEASLYESEKNMRAILDATKESIFMFDRQGNIVSANNTAAIRLNKSLDQIIGHHFSKFVPPEIVPHRMIRLDEVFTSGKPVQFEDERDNIVFEHNFFPLFEKDEVIRIVSYSSDITERKKSEYEIRSAKEEWELTFNTMPDLVAILDDKFQVVRSNKAMIKRLSSIPGAPFSHHCFECMHGTDSPITGCPYAKTLQDGREHTELVHEPLLGGDFLITTTPLKNNDGKIIGSVHIARDITERIRIEEALRISEKKFRSIYENASVGMFMVDPDGNILMSNGAIQNMLGYNEEEFNTMHFIDFTHPDDIEISLNKQVSIYSAEKYEDKIIEKRYIAKDGHLVWVYISLAVIYNETGKPQYHVAIIEDITKRKKAEEALKQSEERYRALVEVSPDAIFVNRNNKLVYFNSAFKVLIGAEKEEQILGKSPYDIFDSAFHHDIRERIKTVLNGGRVPLMENRILRFDGTLRDCDVAATMFKDSQGAAVQVILRDITERKISEHNIKRQNIILSSINEIFKEAFNTLSEETLGQKCLSIIQKITESEIGFIGEIGSDGLLHDIAISEMGWEICKLLDSSGQRRSPGSFKIHGLYGKVLVEGKSFYTNNPEKEPERIGIPDGHPQIKSFVGVPFSKHNKTVGMIALANRLGGYNEEHVELLESLAPVIKEVIKRKQAERALYESEQRLKHHFENSPLAVVEWDTDYIVTRWSKEAEHIFGWKKEETIGNSIDTLNMIFEEDIPVVNKTMERLTSGKEITVVSSNRNYTKYGSVIECTWYNSVLINGKGEMTSVMSLVEDITERKTVERAQLFLLSNNAAETKANFFESLARYLAGTLEMDYICLDKLNGDLLAAKTLAIYYDGRYEDNVEYTLKETPFGEAVGKTICCFPEGVRNLFPNYLILQEMLAESYIGTTLLSNLGQPIGLIACIGRRPLKNRRLAETILKLVAIRAAGELERQNAEDELYESEKTFRSIFENAVVGMLMADINGNIIMCNSAIQNMLGYNQDELKMLHFVDFTHPEDVKKSLNMQKNVYLSKKSDEHKIEKRYIRKDGNIIWVLVSIAVIYNDREKAQYHFAIIENITERKQAEEAIRNLNSELERKVEERTKKLVDANNALKISEEKYQTVADFTYDWEYWFNPEGRTIYVSPSCERITGYTRQEFLDNSDLMYNIVCSDDKKLYSENTKHFMNSKNTCEMEFRIITKDNKLRWIGHACQPVFGNDGEFLGKRGSNKDITKSKLAEEEVSKSSEQLRALAARLEVVREEEKAHISREIHDELGHMLTALKYDLEEIANKSELSARSSESEISPLISMVDSLIDTVRKISTELRPGILDHFGLIPSLEWLLEQFEIRTRIKCNSNFIKDDLLLNKEETIVIFRIFQEILTNIARHSKATYIDIELDKTNDLIKLQVKDNGQGFEDIDIANKNFLGLLGMRERAISIGGDLAIKSTIGKGTSVTFLLKNK